MPVLWWRSVGHTHTGYAVETFLDQLLVAGGKDPVQGRLDLMKGDRPRDRAVLERVQEANQALAKPLPLMVKIAPDLDDAGLDPARFDGDVGVWCGKGTSEYLVHNVLGHAELIEHYGHFPTEIATEKDHVATRVAYELDLRGPAVSVNTACSTALLAVNLAVDALRMRRCDAALAGGVCIHSPLHRGYLAGQGGSASRDGRVRPFDAEATGTVFSSGLGLVVLKRLDDALRDGDNVRAVILGVGVNNNGALPASFMGPSADGQAETVRRALDDAGVPARSVASCAFRTAPAPQSLALRLRIIPTRLSSRAVSICASVM